jgi:hypothetical protein
MFKILILIASLYSWQDKVVGIIDADTIRVLSRVSARAVLYQIPKKLFTT